MTTALYVINETRCVSPELKARVYDAVKELGYQPNILTRSLRCGKTNILGLLLPDNVNPFFAEIGRYLAGLFFISPSSQRAAGIQCAMEITGFIFDESIIWQVDFHAESGCWATLKLLQHPDPLSASIVCNDLIAIGALQAARDAGRSVPEDLSVLGFDDIELASFTIFELTTIVQPKEDIGKIAVSMLIDRIQEYQLPIRKEFIPIH